MLCSIGISLSNYCIVFCPFLNIGHRILPTILKVFFSCFHIFIINLNILCFSVRPPLFINSSSISSGPAALLGFIFFIISFIFSYVGSSSSKLFIGSSCVSMLIILSASGFNNSLNYFAIFPVFVFVLIICCSL